MLSMMATIDEGDLAFECPVCFELLDHTWRMLSCKHNFCSDCLEKVYELNENPQCPTCREVIMVSIEQLQTPPLLLFNLYDKYKRDRDERIQAKNDELSFAIEQSISQYLANQNLDLEADEDEQFHSALCLSADQSVLEAENESVLRTQESRDLNQALQLSAQELVVSGEGSGDALLVNVASGLNVPNLTGENSAGGLVILPRVDGDNTQPNRPEEILNQSGLNVPNLNKYLRVDHQNFALGELVSDVTDEEKLNSLENSRISDYLEMINEYLNALKSYRSDRKIEIIDESGEDRATMERILELEDTDENRGGENAAVDVEREDDDIEMAEQISRQMNLGLDNDVLLNVMLKKSEILDPIDSLRMHFNDMKEKLEIRKVIIESQIEYVLG